MPRMIIPTKDALNSVAEDVKNNKESIAKHEDMFRIQCAVNKGIIAVQRKHREEIETLKHVLVFCLVILGIMAGTMLYILFNMI